jgi:chemotaxis protein CheX
VKQYVQPFIKVCTNVFRDFVGQELQAEMPYFTDSRATHEWDISAIIGLTGEARGAVVISMKQDLAMELTSILTGATHVSMRARALNNELPSDDDVVDAIGEIVNIIAGNVKQELEEAFRLVISLPTIIKGKGHSITWPNEQARIVCIPFKIFNAESFGLSVALEEVKAP